MKKYIAEPHKNVFLHDARSGESRFLDTTLEVDELWDAIITEDEDTRVPRQVILVKESTTQYMKLCSTIDIYTRLNCLQTANSRELEVVFSFRTPHYNQLKHMFAEYLSTNYKHIRGDWYDLSDADLRDFVCNGVPHCLEYVH
jgi:hypothetical protein